MESKGGRPAHKDVQYFLGVAYANGRGVDHQSDKEAVQLYRRAADQENANAQFFMGLVYEHASAQIYLGWL